VTQTLISLHLTAQAAAWRESLPDNHSTLYVAMAGFHQICALDLLRGMMRTMQVRQDSGTCQQSGIDARVATA
jgi:hypothetical protein